MNKETFYIAIFCIFSSNMLLDFKNTQKCKKETKKERNCPIFNTNRNSNNII